MRKLGEARSEAERDIEAAIARIEDWRGRAVTYEPVSGGISNANWRVRVAGCGTDFFVKIPGKGTEMFIDRLAAHDGSVRAAESGYGAKVHYFLEDEGVEVFEFVEGYRTSTNNDFLVEEVRRNALRALKAYNGQAPLRLTKTVFDMIEEHLGQVEELGGHHPPDIWWLRSQYQQARAALEAAGIDLVPCMNDTLAGNFMLNDANGVLLVDFEYASNNDPFYELGLWFGEMFFPPRIELELLEEYFGRVDERVIARLNIGKALADLKWSTWAMVQSQVSKLDFDFHKYGIWKHMRARQAMHDPRWDGWLRAV